MEQMPEDSMDDFDTEIMDDALMADESQQAGSRKGRSDPSVSRRRIEALMERKRLKSQLDDDFYHQDLPDDF